MLTVEQARQLADGEPDIVGLLREYAEVEAGYREVIAAMGADLQPEVAPVMNSAEVTLSFQADGSAVVLFSPVE